MKTLYLECNMGAAGDMLMAALLEIHENPGDFLSRLNGAGVPGVSVTAEPSEKHGVTGTRIKVEVNGQEEDEHHHGHTHHHSDLHHIEHIVGHLDVPPVVRKNVMEIYKLIAEAESKVHGE